MSKSATILGRCRRRCCHHDSDRALQACELPVHIFTTLAWSHGATLYRHRGTHRRHRCSSRPSRRWCPGGIGLMLGAIGATSSPTWCIDRRTGAKEGGGTLFIMGIVVDLLQHVAGSARQPPVIGPKLRNPSGRHSAAPSPNSDLTVALPAGPPGVPTPPEQVPCLSRRSSTPTDEAPALATYSFLPIIKAFTGPAGIGVKLRRFALRPHHRSLPKLTDAQKQGDALAELGSSPRPQLPTSSSCRTSRFDSLADRRHRRTAGHSTASQLPDRSGQRRRRAIKARYAKTRLEPSPA